MTNTAPNFPGTEKVLNHFGYWLDFHDSHVISCEFSLNGPDARTLDLVLHAFSMTREVDAEGYFILNKHCLVHFRFQEITSLELDGFVPSNIIFELNFIENRDSNDWTVDAQMIIDPDLKFTCTKPEIISLILCDSKGKVL